MDISKYPQVIQDRVTIKQVAYGGTCKPATSYAYEIEASEWTLHHEMGHATAKILGIEQELAEMVWNLPGSERVTNDNIFCYGAQEQQRGNCRKARAEYAADAIQAYMLNWPELPKKVKEYIQYKISQALY